MSTCLLPLMACAALAWMQSPQKEILRPGVVERDELTDAMVWPEAPFANVSGPVLAKAYDLTVTGPETMCIELRSPRFDSQLVLLDHEGRVVSMDDDGLLGFHARIVFDPTDPRGAYTVVACSGDGLSGEFELSVTVGLPEPLLFSERMERLVADLEDRIRLLGQGLPLASLANSLRRRGEARMQASDLSGADHDLSRALALYESASSTEDAEVAACLADLAALRRMLGEYEEARQLARRALQLAEEQSVPSLVARCHGVVGAILRDLGDYGAAGGHLEAAVTQQDRTEALAQAVGELGELEYLVGDYVAAQAHFERVLELLEVLPPDHPLLAQAQYNLAQALHALGRLDVAETHFERSLAAFEQHAPDHIVRPVALSSYGYLQRSLGDFQGATRTHEKALALQESLLPREHSNTALLLMNFGETLSARGEYQQAMAHFKEALSIFELSVGKRHQYVAVALMNVGVTLFSSGDVEAAHRELLKSHAILKDALGVDHPTTVHGLANVAVMLQHLEQFDLALTHFRDVLVDFERIYGSSHYHTAWILEQISAVLQNQRDYSGALDYLQQALAGYEDALGADHPRTLVAVASMAVLLGDNAEYQQAKAYHERAVAGYTNALGPDHPETGRIHGNFAFVLTKMGEFGSARQHCERALSILRASFGDRHPEVAQELQNLAEIVNRLGGQRDALRLQEAAVSIFLESLGPQHGETAAAINNLAVMLTSAGEYQDAIKELRRALAVLAEIYGHRSLYVAEVENNLGAAYGAMLDYENAVLHYERSLEIQESLLGDHPFTASMLKNLGTLHYNLGDLDAAKPYLTRARSIYQDYLGDSHPLSLEASYGVARLLHALGQHDEARQLALQTCDQGIRHAQDLLRQLTERESYEFLAGVEKHLMLLLGLPESEQDASAVYEALMRWKGQVGRQLMRTRDQLRRASTQDQLSRLDELMNCQRKLSRLALDSTLTDEQLTELRQLREERNRLELTLRRSAETSVPSSQDFESLIDRLAEDVAILDFFVVDTTFDSQLTEEKQREKRSLEVWILRRGMQTPTRMSLGKVSSIEGELKAYLHAVLGSGMDPLVEGRGVRVFARKRVNAGAALYARLWAPLADLLDGINTVIVSPDGALGTLPFETLQDSGGRYLIEDYAFAYVQDIAAIREPVARPTADPSTLLLCGGVNYDKGGYSTESANSTSSEVAVDRWSELPGTLAEVRAVAELHSRASSEAARVVEGDLATEETLKRELPGHAFVHLATHGFFRPSQRRSLWDSARRGPTGPGWSANRSLDDLVGEHPAVLSGLVCAGANFPATQVDDGYLTAEEVGWLDLGGAELVVLSACDTGLGRPQSGEGLIGLRRAFLTAGARTVVSSLWSIGDESTVELMRDFYANLWFEGMGPLEALRSAQLEMLRANRSEQGDGLPATWGGFVLSGEWR